MEDFVRECHVRKKQRQHYLTNTPYESLPHAAMVGSKGRVELPINTSAPCSRPHLSLDQAPGYLCLCFEEVRPIVIVDLGRASTPGNKTDEAVYEGIGLQAAKNLNVNGSRLETREYTAPSLDLPAIDLKQYWTKQVRSRDIKGSSSCQTPLGWEISHLLIKWWRIKTFAHHTLSSYLLDHVSRPHNPVSHMKVAQCPLSA